jgi:hypothetical protein
VVRRSEGGRNDQLMRSFRVGVEREKWFSVLFGIFRHRVSGLKYCLKRGLKVEFEEMPD